MLEAIVRISPSQPNEAVARIASLNRSCRVLIPEQVFLD
jgi:hypothetical protein